MIKKQNVFLSILVIVMFAPLVGVMADDGYVLLAFYDLSEGATDSTVSTLTIKAVLYKDGLRVTESVEIKITYFSGSTNSNTPIPMNDDGSGLFTYEFTQTFDGYVSLQFEAYVDGLQVDSDYLSIDIPQADEEEELMPPSSSVSTYHPSPGESIEVVSYIPAVDQGTISDTEATVSISFRITDYLTEQTITSTYTGSGIYTASFTLPSFDPSPGVPHLNIDVDTTYSGKTFNEFFWLDFNPFKVLTKGFLEGTTLTLDVLALEHSYAPIAGVEVNTTLIFYRDDSTLNEQLNVLFSPTDTEGRSTSTLNINQTNLERIVVGIQATWGSAVIQSTTYIYVPNEDPSIPEYFMVYPSADYLKDLLENHQKGLHIDMQATMGTNPLANVEIQGYASWRRGLIDAFTVTTDENGLFSIDIDWPEGMNEQDIVELEFVYFDGTDYQEAELGMSKAPEDLEFNEGIEPDLSVTSYSDYQIVTITYRLSAQIATFYTIPMYDESSIFIGSSQILNSPFMDYDSTMFGRNVVPTNDIITLNTIIDTSFTLEYLAIIIQYPDVTTELGMKFVIWLMDLEGNKIGSPSPNIPSITGFDSISMILIMMGMVSVAFLHTKHRVKK